MNKKNFTDSFIVNSLAGPVDFFNGEDISWTTLNDKVTFLENAGTHTEGSLVSVITITDSLGTTLTPITITTPWGTNKATTWAAHAAAILAGVSSYIQSCDYGVTTANTVTTTCKPGYSLTMTLVVTKGGTDTVSVGSATYTGGKWIPTNYASKQNMVTVGFSYISASTAAITLIVHPINAFDANGNKKYVKLTLSPYYYISQIVCDEILKTGSSAGAFTSGSLIIWFGM